MEAMNVNKTRKARTPKVKLYTVDTRKPDAAAMLAAFIPERGYAELVSSRATRKAPVFRYFYAVGVAPSAPANNYGPVSANDSLNDLIGKMAHVGVSSADEFDELADLFERKAAIGGRRSRRNTRKARKGRKATRKH